MAENAEEKGCLLVDIGNSRVKWAVAEHGELKVGAAFPSDAAEFGKSLDRLWRDMGAPRAAHASNVAGDAMADRLAEWVARRWNLPVRFARSEARAHGVINGYRQPERLGVDRWMGLIALRHDYALPACLVDCGTALTLDVLDETGRHLGGLIAPGPALMRRALLRETQGVRPEGTAAGGPLGLDTAACAGLVEKTLSELAPALDRAPTLVLSGGDGGLLGQALPIPYRLAPDLVLRGLLIIATTEST